MANPSLLGPWVRRFLLEYLVSEKNLARNTQWSYRDTLRLLLPFLARHARRAVDRLIVTDLTPERLRLFLNEIEEKRMCSVATRNQRLATIRSLAHYIGLQSPEHVAWCGQIRALAFKKAPHPLVTYLEKVEMDALLAAPDQHATQGQRDHALLLFLYNTGARADESAQAVVGDLGLPEVSGREPSSVLIHGKGNKMRRCPLWTQTSRELSALVRGRSPHEHIFLNRSGRPLTRFGVHSLVERYAIRGCPRPFIAWQARQSARDPAYDGDTSVACRGRHQHHSGMVGACLADHDQRVRRGRSGNEGKGTGNLRNARSKTP